MSPDPERNVTIDGIIFMESSGVVREAFRALGLNVYSCDLQAADDGSPHHFQGDVRTVIGEHKARFYGFHPTCTFLCGSGIHWNNRERVSQADQPQARPN